MNREEIINAIETVRKYNSETDRIEIKAAKEDFPKKCYDTFSSFSNRFFLVFQTDLAVLSYLV